jgi:hypothetical protein
MKPYRFNAKSIISAITITSIVIFSSVLLIKKITTTLTLFSILIHWSLFTLLLTMVWILLNKYIWRTRWVQQFRPLLGIIPDVNGRYVGYIHRLGESPKPFVIEIFQTLTNIVIYSYSGHSKTKSHIAEIATDEAGQKFHICFFWEGSYTQAGRNKIHENAFLGYTILEIFDTELPKRIRGEFFSNKEKHGLGHIDLVWESYELLGRLEGIEQSKAAA